MPAARQKDSARSIAGDRIIGVDVPRALAAARKEEASWEIILGSCALVSIALAGFVLEDYWTSRNPISFWCGLGFVLVALNLVLLIARHSHHA